MHGDKRTTSFHLISSNAPDVQNLKWEKNRESPVLVNKQTGWVTTTESSSSHWHRILLRRYCNKNEIIIIKMNPGPDFISCSILQTADAGSHLTSAFPRPRGGQPQLPGKCKLDTANGLSPSVIHLGENSFHGKKYWFLASCQRLVIILNIYHQQVLFIQHAINASTNKALYSKPSSSPASRRAGTCPSTCLGFLNQREQFPKHWMPPCPFLLGTDFVTVRSFLFTLKWKLLKTTFQVWAPSQTNASCPSFVLTRPTAPTEWPDLAKRNR